MLKKGLFVVYLTCMVLCYGTVDENFNTRIKREEDAQINTEGNTQSTKNDEPISRDNKEDFINLRIGDVTRALSQNVPKLSNINNILPSIPLPVQLLLKDNNQNNELNTKPHNLQGKESNKISNNNNIDIKPSIKRRPSKKIKTNKIGNDNNDNAEITDMSRRSQTPNQTENNKHSLILENKLNNRKIDTENIISPKDYNKEHLFDEAIIPLLKVLGNSLKLNEFDTNSVTKQKSLENKNPEVHKASNSLDTKDVLPNKKLTKILEEQNNLLKYILFKTLNYKKETKDYDESDTKKIHLILNINNSEDNENDNPDNTVKKRNNFEKLLNIILYRDRNNTDEDKNENKARLEETFKDLRNDTANQYVYFNDRNIRTYIYSTNAEKNQLSRRLYNYKINPKQYPYTDVDWKRFNDLGHNQTLRNIRVIFVPRDEVKITIPSKNYELYKKLKSNQLYQYALQGLNLDRKFNYKCPYHGV